MATFTILGRDDLTFEAAELRGAQDGKSTPVVTDRVLLQVVARLRRRFRWVGKVMAVAAPGPGEVIEVLRPRPDGLYDLGDAPSIELAVHAPKRGARARRSAAAADTSQAAAAL